METRALPPLGGVHAEIRKRVRRRRTRAAAVNAWEEIDRAVNPSFFKPRLRPDIEIRDFVRRDGLSYTMVKTPRGPNYIRLTAEERSLVGLMDGTRTVKDLVVGRFRESGTFELSAVADLVEELYQQGFLDRTYDPVVERTLEAKKAKRLRVPRWMREFAATRRLEFPGSHRFFSAMYRWGARFFFMKPVVIVCAVISLAGMVAFFVLLGEHKYTLIGESAAASVGLLYVADYASTFVHESGHALATIHAGRRVNSAGFMLYLGMPAFFIETTDTWMAPRKGRMTAAAAGPFIETVTAGIATMAALWLPATAITLFLYRYAVLCYITIAQNLIPFLRLDGYYIMMDALEEQNLRERSFEFVRFDLLGKIRKREKFSRLERIFAGYGILAVLFTALAVFLSVLFWSGILSDALTNAWRGGWTSRILVTVLVALVAAPLLRAMIRLIRAIVRRVRPLVRLARRATERRWREEAAALFRALPLVDALDDDAVAEIADHVRLVRVPRGGVVVKQGEPGSEFYVVRSGSLEVTRVEDGEERFLRKRERGRSFGEIALLEHTTRTATVRALEPSEVFAIDKGTFDRALASNFEVANEVRGELLSIADLRAMAPFAALDDADAGRLLGGASWVTFDPGERIVKQGDDADAFYVIASGQVDVIENRRRVGRLGAGDYFGEIALLTREPRTATVRAATPVRVLELERKAFDRVLAKSFRKGRLAASRTLTREWEH
ncbi:MAG: cyclic nucleotide-binding domain-containing protein [Actinomycetota bacterium]